MLWIAIRQFPCRSWHPWSHKLENRGRIFERINVKLLPWQQLSKSNQSLFSQNHNRSNYVTHSRLLYPSLTTLNYTLLWSKIRCDHYISIFASKYLHWTNIWHRMCGIRSLHFMKHIIIESVIKKLIKPKLLTFSPK